MYNKCLVKKYDFDGSKITIVANSNEEYFVVIDGEFAKALPFLDASEVNSWNLTEETGMGAIDAGRVAQYSEIHECLYDIDNAPIYDESKSGKFMEFLSFAGNRAMDEAMGLTEAKKLHGKHVFAIDNGRVISFFARVDSNETISSGAPYHKVFCIESVFTSKEDLIETISNRAEAAHKEDYNGRLYGEYFIDIDNIDRFILGDHTEELLGMLGDLINAGLSPDTQVKVDVATIVSWSKEHKRLLVKATEVSLRSDS